MPKEGRQWLVVPAGIAVVMALAGFLAFAALSEKRFPAGTTVGGVPVGDLAVADARERLREAAAELRQGRLVVADGERRASVRWSSVGLDPGWERALDDAVSDLGSRWDPRRLLPRGSRQYEAEGRLDPRGLREAIIAVAERVDRPPRDAAVDLLASGPQLRRALHGRAIERFGLRDRLVEAARRTWSAGDQRLELPVRALRPAVSNQQALAAYDPAIVVDRGSFQLRLYRGTRLERSYPIAIGQIGHTTPAGEYAVESMQVDPAWHVPRSEWAGELAGQVIPPGDPRNPLRARWIGVAGPVGIHGTDAPGSIGGQASRGCIRMHPGDVIDLYERVGMGTPVLIS